MLVTGATGRIGRQVVDHLLAANVPARALTRNPGGAGLPSAVDVVAGDLAVPESLEASLQGISAVFLLWTIPATTAPGVVERLAAHAQRVVFLSSPHQTPHPFFQQPNPGATLHATIEGLITEAGLASTMIRPGMFSSNTLHWWSDLIKNGQPIRWPFAAAETAPIDERDVGAVAARALYDDSHVGGDYVLTGPESLSQEEQARIIGAAVGREVEFEELTADEFRRETAETWPQPVVEMLIAAWQATMGQPAYVTSTVFDVTGTPARSFAQWAADHADAFRN